MAHASVFTSRRGSNTSSSGTSASSNVASINCTAQPTEDHQTSLIMHHTPPAGSSSPGPHHPPPHSLNIHGQSQSLQSAGPQVKKKSGFQITSVLPAQVSASTNNSIADDTESYDDMDESHTEDLSSSDILDVSVSRATDTGIPERSSSEETLNSLHGGETPGVVSPNEPVMHHSHSQSSQQGYMVNGTVYHHHHSHQPHRHPKDQGAHSVAAPQPVQGVPGTYASVATVVPATATSAQSGATVQGRTHRAPSVHAAVVDASVTGIVTQALSSLSSSTSSSSGAGIVGGVVGASAVVGGLPNTAGTTGNTVTGLASHTPAAITTSQIPAVTTATATASRFRVVKLDSSSEPFRKGRWICTEYYEKETTAAASSTDAAPTHRAVESVIQSETESTSGSSSSSTMSCGGDQGTQPVQQAFAQTAVPVSHQGIPQTTLHLHTHSQDPGTHAVVSPAVAPPSNQQVVPVPGMLSSEGHAAPARPQQQILYTLDGQVSQLQSSYSMNQQASMPVNQGLQPVDYAQISQGIQATTQPHQIPVQGSVTRATPVPTQIPGLTVGTPVVVPQDVSPRPQVPASQMVLAQGSVMNQAQPHPPQIPSDQQQQAAVSQAPPPSSSTAGQTAPCMPSATFQSNIQPGLPQALQHGGPVAGHAGGQGLTLRQAAQLAPTGSHFGVMAPLTASQLEDAGRLLFQHQSLLSLPRFATGGVAGLMGQSASEAVATLGQDGSANADACALATAVGTDEDR